MVLSIAALAKFKFGEGGGENSPPGTNRVDGMYKNHACARATNFITFSASTNQVCNPLE